MFLPLTHLMTLVSDPAARDSLDMLALYVTSEFIKQVRHAWDWHSLSMSHWNRAYNYYVQQQQQQQHLLNKNNDNFSGRPGDGA